MKKISREYLLVAILILSAVVMIELQYVVGKYNTPPNATYLGTVHWPADYFYYLSQMIQGKNHFLSSTILYTSEKLEPVYIGWQTVITGKIFLSLGLDVISSYQAGVILYLFSFLVLSYLILKRFFPESLFKRIMALFFFIFSTSLFYWDKGSLHYYTFWYNLGSALSRFGPTPHHLFANTIATASILLTLSWFDAKKITRLHLAGLIFFGFTMASITPVHWGLIVLGGSITLFLRQIFPVKKLLYLAVPVYLLFLSGIPSALYAKRVFSMVPYSYSQDWEATQKVNMDLLWLIKGSGVIILFAIVGLLGRKKGLSSTKLFGLSFILACSLFYFFPIPVRLHMTNARFWPSTVYIFIAAFAVEGIYFLSELFKKRGKIVLLLLTSLFVATCVPTFYAQYKEILTPQPSNAFFYLPNDAIRIYKKAEIVSHPSDVFLVEWPFNETFPALTARKSFFGFYLLTINSSEKERLAFEFFDGRMKNEDAQNFLERFGISYIIGYPWTPKIATYPFLTKIEANNSLGLYKVKK